MKGRHLSVLVVAAVVAVVAALWTSDIREPASDGPGLPDAKLFPGLADNLNDVTGLRLTGPGDTPIATLQRVDDAWVLAEKNGYRANLADLRDLLLKLAQAELLEEKTSNPEFYERLGVQDLDTEAATGVLVQLEGVDAPPLIVGDQAGSRQAVYVRRAGEATSWLVSGDIFVADDVSEWVDRDVLDISASRIAEVDIRHADGATITLSKSAFGQENFEVSAVPADRELERDSIANPIGSVIQGLRFDDVLPAAEHAMDANEATRTRFSTFDGLVIDALVMARDDKYYVQFSAAGDAEVARRYQPVPEVAEGEELPPLPPAPDISGVAAEAEELNRRLGGWVYEIPKFKYDHLARQMEDLLKDTG